MIYTTEDLRRKILPIARKYDLKSVWLFGSYARGEATEDSDVDCLVDHENSKIVTFFDLGGLYNDLHEILQKKVDILLLDTLNEEKYRQVADLFISNVMTDRTCIYERVPADG